MSSYKNSFPCGISPQWNSPPPSSSPFTNGRKEKFEDYNIRKMPSLNFDGFEWMNQEFQNHPLKKNQDKIINLISPTIVLLSFLFFSKKICDFLYMK